MPRPSKQESAKSTSLSPARNARGALGPKYDDRGGHRSRLYHGYSPKANKDVTFTGHAEHAHFLLVEADAQVVRVDYDPEPQIVQIKGDNIRTKLDAKLECRSGVRRWREIKSDSDSLSPREEAQLEAQTTLAAMAGAVYERLTLKDLFANEVLVQNWNRVVHALDLWKLELLIEQANHVRKLFKAHADLTLAEIHREGKAVFENGFSVVVAALRAVQHGELSSDLDRQPLSLATQLSRSGGRL